MCYYVLLCVTGLPSLNYSTSFQVFSEPGSLSIRLTSSEQNDNKLSLDLYEILYTSLNSVSVGGDWQAVNISQRNGSISLGALDNNVEYVVYVIPYASYEGTLHKGGRSELSDPITPGMSMCRSMCRSM